jgi:CO/xanthine dehydrogenase FAD-binding subunit
MLQHVYVPNTIDEALADFATGPASMLLSGGTLVMPVINNEASAIRSLVCLRNLPLNTIDFDARQATIGATTTLAEVGLDARLSFLQPAVESIASPPIRNLATVGGNLFAAQPYGDFAVALLALNAVVDVHGPNGIRQLPVAEVPNQGLLHGEIVTSVAFAVPPEGSWFYTKAMRRKLNSASIVTVAAVIEVAGNVVREARVALGGMGPRPIRAHAVEAALIGNPLGAESVTAAAARGIDDVEPLSDAYASAWYRARVLPVHIRRAILGA